MKSPGNPGKRRAPYACGLAPEVSAGRSAKRVSARTARWFNSKGRSGQKFRNSRRAALSPSDHVTIPLRGRNLPLSDALFEHDALCFLDCKSRSLTFIDASGASITMEYESFQHAALWTRPGAPFLCLEAWTGYSDPEGFTGDLFDKPSMRVLEPGGRARHEARFVFRPE